MCALYVDWFTIRTQLNWMDVARNEFFAVRVDTTHAHTDARTEMRLDVCVCVHVHVNTTHCFCMAWLMRFASQRALLRPTNSVHMHVCVCVRVYVCVHRTILPMTGNFRTSTDVAVDRRYVSPFFGRCDLGATVIPGFGLQWAQRHLTMESGTIDGHGLCLNVGFRLQFWNQKCRGCDRMSTIDYCWKKNTQEYISIFVFLFSHMEKKLIKLFFLPQFIITVYSDISSSIIIIHLHSWC